MKGKYNDRIQIRIPDETLLEFIRQGAKENKRSLTQEINYLLKLGQSQMIKEKNMIDAIRSGKTQINAEFGEKLKKK